MSIWIDGRRVADDWTPARGVTSVGYVSLDSGATLTLPEGVTSVGYVRLDSGATLTLPEGCTIKGHKQADPAIAKQRLINVAKHALAEPRRLKMDVWHSESGGCGTSHCIAGWAVHLEGDAGYALEREVGPAAAGILLLGVEASKLFFLDDDDARTALHGVLAAAGEHAPTIGA